MEPKKYWLKYEKKNVTLVGEPLAKGENYIIRETQGIRDQTGKICKIQDDAALVSTQMVDPDADQEIQEITDKWSRLDFNITETDGVDFKASLSFLNQFGEKTGFGCPGKSG